MFERFRSDQRWSMAAVTTVTTVTLIRHGFANIRRDVVQNVDRYTVPVTGDWKSCFCEFYIGILHHSSEPSYDQYDSMWRIRMISFLNRTL